MSTGVAGTFELDKGRYLNTAHAPLAGIESTACPRWEDTEPWKVPRPCFSLLLVVVSACVRLYSNFGVLSWWRDWISEYNGFPMYVGSARGPCQLSIVKRSLLLMQGGGG